MTRSGILRYPKQIRESLKAPLPAAHPLDPAGAQTMLAPALLGELAAMWIGHSTVLLRIGKRWVLTDPVLSERIGVRVGPYTIGLGRLSPPVIPPQLMPEIDLILVSHAHFDHLDGPTLRALARRSTTVITAPRTRRLIPPGFGHVEELAWDRGFDLGDLRVDAIRPEHWGARAALDRRRGYNSYRISAGDRRVLFAGDTADTRAFAGLGPLDLAIFGIGGYEPWVHAHATPEQVWRMAGEAGAAHILPVHHSTFPQSDEPVDEPLRRLLEAAGTEGSRVVGAAPGQMWTLG